MKTIYSSYLGRTEYKSAWDLQRKLFDLRVANKIPDVLLLTEHEHVYTLGKSSDDDHLLANEDMLRTKGASVFKIDRGGDVTYHGPGQLVGYPILDLGNFYHDVHRYLRDLEEVIIRTLDEYGIKGHRENDFTGVWVGNDKIAALGVKVSHWITMHGFAFNINTDLQYFESIIPCGIFHKGVTSLQQLLGREVPLTEISSKLVRHFSQVFETEITEVPPQTILDFKTINITENSEWHQAVKVQ